MFDVAETSLKITVPNMILCLEDKIEKADPK